MLWAMPFLLKGRWEMLFDTTDASREAYIRVRDRYQANNLAYHNFEHIFECMEALDVTSTLAEDHTLIQAAIWYHDAIYDPKRKDNEELSAKLAMKELSELTIDGQSINTLAVYELIMATKHAELPTTPDAKLLVDIDLRILGTDVIRYSRYMGAIRSEYGWVPEADYRAGRAKVMQTFLDRAYIYSTDFFREHYEAQARKNIANEIAWLTRT